MTTDTHAWPELALENWEPTRATLHMWTQVVGKTRLALCSPQNHFWNVALYVSARGLTTSPIPYPGGVFEVEFDFVAHVLNISTSAGETRSIKLEPKSVATFYRHYVEALSSLGIDVHITRLPCELPAPIAFDKDEEHKSYDPVYANRFWRILVQVDSVLKQFRSRFLAKVSPVHFFWGSFDMAFTMFSGRPAPAKPDADPITREAYSHEVISVGFWPGDARYPKPAFYAYAAPAPAGLADAKISPEGAGYDTTLGEYLLPYDAVRTSADPRAAVLAFADSTYEAASRLAHWDSGLVRS